MTTYIHGNNTSTPSECSASNPTVRHCACTHTVVPRTKQRTIRSTEAMDRPLSDGIYSYRCSIFGAVIPMNIEDTECIANLFTILHDGAISQASFVSGDLILEIQIQYLAERIDSSFKQFLLCLSNIRDIRFSTWPKNSQMLPSEITDTALVFRPQMTILGGDTKGRAIQVICSINGPEFDYCGGELYFQADSAYVTDEAGRPYSFSELLSLSNAYWDEWFTRTGA